MGLFDFLKKGDSPRGEDKELARLQKMVSNKLSQNVDREDALHRLAAMATPAAVSVLLTRFNWTLNPSIKDQEEKEVAVQGIVAAGEAGLETICNYCIRAEALTWPLKAIKGIVSDPGQLETVLLEVLDEFDTDYMRNPEPKVQLMQALGEFSSDDVRVACEPFMMDQSEEVRFAAVTTVLGCNQAESLDSFIEAMKEEESLRVKNRIATGIVEKAWSLTSAQEEELRGCCPPGFGVKGGVLVGRPAS